MLDRILREGLRRVVQYDSASVQLLNKIGTGLEIIACQGFEKPDVVRALIFPVDALDKHPNVKAWRERRFLIYPDVRKHFPVFDDPQFQAQHIRGWLGVPLNYGTRWIGALSIDSRRIDAFNEEHAALAMTFANQAAGDRH